MSEKIGLVYLNRRAEGNFPVQRFIDSYKALDSGLAHEFITIYKGFTASEKEVAEQLFTGVERQHIVVDDDMTDIDAYLITAEAFPDIDVFCFLNTFSEVACKNWLLILFNALSINNVGIAGATASYESLLNSNRLISKVLWLCNNDFLKYDRKLHLQYKTIIEKHQSRWLRKHLFTQFISRIREQQHDYEYIKAYDDMFEEYWRILTSHNGVYEFLNGYPPFPNPHIRSNGFVIRRAHLLPFFGKLNKMSKNESYLFESGIESLTRQILKTKLRAVVVNSYGHIYDVEDWPLSQTFRLNDQQGLLIKDNQTRGFQKLNLEEKEVHKCMSWGDSTNNMFRRVFTFGIPFEIKKNLGLNEGGVL